MATPRDDFSKQVARKLAERASFFCSNPGCRRVTVGPVISDPTKSTSTGVASHIAAASPGGPRYDMSQSRAQRQSIENGIWLCAACSALVDKNDGADYPAEHLKKWKTDHEALMKECLEGSRRVVLEFRPLNNDLRMALRFLLILESKSSLYAPIHLEDPRLVAKSMGEIREALLKFRMELDDDSPINDFAESVAAACRYYMNVTPVDAHVTEIGYALGAVRKVVGINLLKLTRLLPVSIPAVLRDTLPVA